MLAHVALNILGNSKAGTGPLPLGLLTSENFSELEDGSTGPFVGFSNDPLATNSLAPGAIHTWQVNSGSTPTTGTGPNGDAEGSGKYLFCESNGANVAFWYFNLESGNLDASANTFYLRFNYHMYSSTATDMYLSIQGWNGSSWSEIERLSGPQQVQQSDPYVLVECDSLGFDNVGFKFRLQFFKSDTGGLLQDAAVDNLEIWVGEPT